jgi:putative flippase GtrA
LAASHAGSPHLISTYLYGGVWQSRRVAGWLVLGVAASLVELGVLRLLYEVLGWALPVATAAAAEGLILAKFLIADRWVFNHPWPAWDRLLRYHGASAGALVVYWLVINILALLLATPYVVGFVLGTGAAFTWSLLTNFLWVWARPAPRNVNAGEQTGR